MRICLTVVLLGFLLTAPVGAETVNATSITTADDALKAKPESVESVPVEPAKVVEKPKENKHSFSRESKMPEHIRKEFQAISHQKTGQQIGPQHADTENKLDTKAQRPGSPIVTDPINFGVKYSQFNPNMEFKAIYNFITEKYPKVKTDDAQKIAGYLVDYGKEHDLDPKFVAAVMARESAFNHRAVSSTGAKGLGQIKDFNFPSLNISDPFDIKQNVSGTTAYLRELKKRWSSDKDQARLTLASYFKGPNHVQRANGILDNQTDKYVDDILGYYDDLKQYRERMR
ncbi:MAG: transglycosylase SLT domain-containing protein [bacterium]|nr:transglycosylase SLT domain-containing protein [bacterium]